MLWTYGKLDRRKRVKGGRVVVTDSVQCHDVDVKKSKKCECEAMIYASVHECGEWVLKRVVLKRVMLEHKNHDSTLSKSRHMH